MSFSHIVRNSQSLRIFALRICLRTLNVVASVSSASTLACDVYSPMSKEVYTLTLFCLVFKSLIKSMTFLNLGSDKLRKLKSYEKIVSSLVSDDTFFISLLSKSYLSFSSSWIHLIQLKGKVVVSLHETSPKDKKYYIMQCKQMYDTAHTRMKQWLSKLGSLA